MGIMEALKFQILEYFQFCIFGLEIHDLYHLAGGG